MVDSAPALRSLADERKVTVGFDNNSIGRILNVRGGDYGKTPAH